MRAASWAHLSEDNADSALAQMAGAAIEGVRGLAVSLADPAIAETSPGGFSIDLTNPVLVGLARFELATS